MTCHRSHDQSQQSLPLNCPNLPRPPNVPLLRALWSLLDGIWGVLKGSWGVLVDLGACNTQNSIPPHVQAIANDAQLCSL